MAFAIERECSPPLVMPPTEYELMRNKSEDVGRFAQELSVKLYKKNRQDLEGRKEAARLLSALADKIEPSGQTLFEMHLFFRVGVQIAADENFREHEDILADLWSHLSKEHVDFWAKRTAGILAGLRRGGFEPLKDLQAWGKSPKNIDYPAEIQKVLVSFAESEDGNNPDDPGISPILQKLRSLKPSPYPCNETGFGRGGTPFPRFTFSEALLGFPLPTEEGDLNSVIPAILTSIKDRFVSYEISTPLAIRIYSVRVVFDPESETGIAARLRSAVHRIPGCRMTPPAYDPRKAFEWYLTALAFHHPKIFSELEEFTKSNKRLVSQSARKSYMWRHTYPITKYIGLPDVSALRPISEESKEEVIASIIAELKSQAGSIENDWDYQLSRCFYHTGLRSEEYEDLLEQQLHYLTYREGSNLHPTRKKKDDGDA